jgi:hypothetical protein
MIIMMTENLNISEKKLVDQFVRELACEKIKRFTASYISEKIGVDVDFVKERLLQLRNDDQLVVHFEVACPFGRRYRIIDIYSSLNCVPIGEFVECEDCGDEFVVTEENVWITFSPNEKYYDNEMCKHGQQNH